MQKLGFAVLSGLFVVMLFSFGCSSRSATTQYVCADGTTVANPSDCQTQQSPTGGSHETTSATQAAQTTSPTASSSTDTQTNPSPQPPQERELEDKCTTVPESELNSTEFTETLTNCYTNTYFYPASLGQVDYSECDEIIFMGFRSFCNGVYSGFLGDESKCLQYEGTYKDACIIGYATATVQKDEDSASLALCDGIVNETIMEGCLEIVSPYLSCQNNDNFCPTQCSYLTDNNCPKYSLGQKAITENGMEITISGPARTGHCYTNYDSDYLDDVDYGYYYVLSVNSENSGTQAELVSYSDFILVDSRGTQHEADGYLLGESCADASLFEQKNLYPGSSEAGEVWFELGDQRALPSGETKIVYDPNMFTDGDEIVFVVN